MGSDEPNHITEAVQLHLGYIAADAAQQRANEQRMARLLADRYRMDRAILAERLDVPLEILDRMLGNDGRDRDPSCAQLHHRACIGAWTPPAGADIAVCECECHER